eukprot:SAG31_NODE_3740_length_3932_cov_3.662145_3_plen_316_part_00
MLEHGSATQTRNRLCTKFNSNACPCPEWIRQYHIQGSLHHLLHQWWHRPIEKLQALWARLEKRTAERLAQLASAADGISIGATKPSPTEFLSLQACCVVLIGDLSRRQRLRKAWETRDKDPVFRSLPPDCRPTIPALPDAKNDLEPELTQLRKLQQRLKAAKDRAKPCFAFSKFGNCERLDCPFSHDLQDSDGTKRGSRCETASTKRSAADSSETDTVKVAGATGRADQDREFLKRWQYETDYGDHYETPKIAYSDIRAALRQLAKKCGKTSAALAIYDPYYCTGRAKKLLRRVGFETVRRIRHKPASHPVHSEA